MNCLKSGAPNRAPKALWEVVSERVVFPELIKPEKEEIMAKLFGSGTNKRVTGKAADSGYHAKKSTTPTLQAKLPTLQDLFRSGTSGTGRQVTGKAADSSYTTAKKQASGSKSTGSAKLVKS